MQRFDFTCKTFTDVMAIKHQLQFALFNGSYYFMDKNGSQAKVADGEDHIDYIKNFTIILENLETLTSILQDIRVRSVITIIYIYIDSSVIVLLNFVKRLVF